MYEVIMKGKWKEENFPESIIGGKMLFEFCVNEEMGSWEEELKDIEILKIEKIIVSTKTPKENQDEGN